MTGGGAGGAERGPGRVLVVRVGAMGDVLHALPAAAALRRARPACELEWVVDPRWAPLLVDEQGVGPVVSRVYLAETKMWSRAPWSGATRQSVLGLRQALRAGKYDAAVDMQGTLRSGVIGSFARAPLWGYADPRERAARWFYRHPTARRGVHVVEQGAALLGAACGMALEPGAVELPRWAGAERWAEALVGGERVAVLAASAGWGAKQWPVERFVELARALRARGLRVLTTAPGAEDVLARRLVEGSDGAAEAVVCDVAGLVALLRRAAVVVGGDTGPVHLAAALGVPVVALFGPTDPARNGPWGAGAVRVLRRAESVTSYKRRVEVDPGLARVTVGEVLEAVQETAR